MLFRSLAAVQCVSARLQYFGFHSAFVESHSTCKQPVAGLPLFTKLPRRLAALDVDDAEHLERAFSRSFARSYEAYEV